MSFQSTLGFPVWQLLWSHFPLVLILLKQNQWFLVWVCFLNWKPAVLLLSSSCLRPCLHLALACVSGDPYRCECTQDALRTQWNPMAQTTFGGGLSHLHSEGRPTQLTSSAWVHTNMLSDFHLVHYNANYMLGLSYRPRKVADICEHSACSNLFHQWTSNHNIPSLPLRFGP